MKIEISNVNQKRGGKLLMTAVILCAAVLAIGSGTAKAVILEGNPFVPTGANYSIFALQGIDASTPLGKTGFSPQVNRNFEFTPSIGVSYDTGNGSLTDFGLGLYSNAQGQVQSTGLKIQYNSLVSAASVKITVMDFDIKTGATFFNPLKVEPSILLLAANGSVYASATPSDIFSALVPHVTGGKKGSGDVWDVSFSQLLSNLNKADAQISGFVLYADATAGERPNSDPFLLLSVGNGSGITPVPEVPAFAPLAGVLLMVVGANYVRRRVRIAA